MQKVFCVFEGGGAKGVAHVGALRAIQSESEFDIRGYAGTSAGAIVAALAAAGWTPDDLVQEDEAGKVHSPALAAIGRSDVTNLAGLIGADWAKLRRTRALFNMLKRGGAQTRKMRVMAGLAGAIILFWPFLYIYLRHLRDEAAGTLAAIATVPLEVLLLVGWLAYAAGMGALLYYGFALFARFRGIAGHVDIVNLLDALLRVQVVPSDGHRVSFRDIRDQKNVALKVVAANIDTGRMELFDTEETGDVKVADAVAASAAIPMLFKPVHIGGAQYCDGGLVSNLPAWTFDSERLLSDDGLIVTCELSEAGEVSDAREASRSHRGFSLYERFARTAVSGASDLNTRGLLNHIRMPLSTGLGTLAFERTSLHLRAIRNAETTARFRIGNHRIELDSLDSIHAAAQHYVEGLVGGAEAGLRTALIRPINLSNHAVAAYRIWAARGYEEHGDDRMLLPPSGSIAGDAVRRGTIQVIDRRNAVDWARYEAIRDALPSGKLLARDRQWVVVVPVDAEETSGEADTNWELTAAIAIDGACALPGTLRDHAAAFRDVILENSVFIPYVEVGDGTRGA